MERIFVNENEFGKGIMEMENKICNFVSRLEDGEYKVILYNNQTPILADDLGLFEFIVSDLDEESTVELKNNDVMVIHIENETIMLTGRKRMTEGEIFARKYLDECDSSGSLIIKDHEMQIEMREDNFKDAKDFYKKCKDIVNIRGFIKDESKKVDEVYNMNWDCFWMTYRNGSRELWQRA
ncbi:hypothetical protein GKZ28_13085 [Clostridium chromiireducens]|uniref:Uncharacterized protein n=1 Tax=Clostridium chromiireducens TaxID=225345 RepID=A0A964W310_9CLOT|nr:hypothetical protein [Clostridium chromiireducens]MVX64627.1 hypothetical protein [Clostridium chromiireducens]